ncbi:MAG: T9SS type A sorting domain-containing protein, partial [Flavobacteriales bacterium]
GAYANTDLAQPCTPFVGVEELLTFNDVLVFPSASAGTINVQTEKHKNINEVNVYDNAGALVGSYRLNSNTTVLDLSACANGFYFITFTHANGNQLTKKFTIVK